MNRALKNPSSRLRQRMTLQQEQRTPDTAGGYVRSWQDVADIWAEVIPLSGKEKLFAAQLQSEITHRILIRYRTGISAAHRLVFETRVFNIRSVINVREENALLEILAQEGAGG